MNEKEYNYIIYYSEEVGFKTDSVTLSHTTRYTAEQFDSMVREASRMEESLNLKDIAASLIIDYGFSVKPYEAAYAINLSVNWDNMREQM